jgi:hypothetical protein
MFSKKKRRRIVKKKKGQGQKKSIFCYVEGPGTFGQPNQLVLGFIAVPGIRLSGN